MHTESKLDIARKLARAHFAVDSEMQHIFLLEPIKEQDCSEPIKLLEVVDGTVERWIDPVAFAPNPTHGNPFPMWIVEVSPDEFNRIDPKSIVFRDQVWTLGEELSR